MRIALVCVKASPPLAGSIDREVRDGCTGQMAASLVAAGHTVDIFTRRADPVAPDMDMYRGACVFPVKAGPAAVLREEELLPCMAEFARGIAGHAALFGAYDIVHANCWIAGFAALMVRRATGIPFVVTFHPPACGRLPRQRATDEPQAQGPSIEEAVIRAADGIIAECPQDRAAVVHCYGAAPGKTALIPRGFDRRDFWPVPIKMARAVLGRNNEKIILAAGRRSPRNGLETAIRAFRQLRAETDTQTALIIMDNSVSGGFGPARETGRLMRTVRQEKVEGRVIFAGRVEKNELKYYYSAADLLVTVPWHETTGIAPLEAMACGTPVIETVSPGGNSAVIDGETGFLVPPLDEKALAAKMRLLVENDALRNTLGKNARAHACRNFTWLNITASISRFYAQVTGKAARAAGDGAAGVFSGAHE